MPYGKSQLPTVTPPAATVVTVDGVVLSRRRQALDAVRQALGGRPLDAAELEELERFAALLAPWHAMPAAGAARETLVLALGEALGFEVVVPRAAPPAPAPLVVPAVVPVSPTPPPTAPADASALTDLTE